MCDTWRAAKRNHKRWTRHWTKEDLRTLRANHARHCPECGGSGWTVPRNLPRDPNQRPQED